MYLTRIQWRLRRPRLNAARAHKEAEPIRNNITHCRMQQRRRVLKRHRSACAVSLWKPKCSKALSLSLSLVTKARARAPGDEEDDNNNNNNNNNNHNNNNNKGGREAGGSMEAVTRWKLDLTCAGLRGKSVGWWKRGTMWNCAWARCSSTRRCSSEKLFWLDGLHGSVLSLYCASESHGFRGIYKKTFWYITGTIAMRNNALHSRLQSIEATFQKICDSSWTIHRIHL